MMSATECTCACMCGYNLGQSAPSVPDLPGEEWRWLVGHEPSYEISNMGRVRSYIRKGPRGRFNRVARMLTLTADAEGYRILTIAAKGYKVHRLVLETFVGPSDLVTRHLNNNPADNRLENLRWGTQAENMRDRVIAGNHNRQRKAVSA